VLRSLQETLGTRLEEWGFHLSFGDGQVEEKDCMRNPEKLVTTRMDPEGIMLSETSQSQKDRYCVSSLTYGI